MRLLSLSGASIQRRPSPDKFSVAQETSADAEACSEPGNRSRAAGDERSFIRGHAHGEFVCRSCVLLGDVDQESEDRVPSGAACRPESLHVKSNLSSIRDTSFRRIAFYAAQARAFVTFQWTNFYAQGSLFTEVFSRVPCHPGPPESDHSKRSDSTPTTVAATAGGGGTLSTHPLPLDNLETA